MVGPIAIVIVSVAMLVAWGTMGPRGQAIMQTWVGLAMAVLCGARLAGFDQVGRTLFDSERFEALWLIFILTLGLVTAAIGAQQLRKPRSKEA